MDKPISQKKFLLHAKIFLTAALVLSVLLFVPLAYMTMQASTNVDFKIDYLLDVLDVLMLTVSILTFSATYATLIYSFFAFDTKKSIFMIVAVTVMPVIKNAANLLTEWLRDGVPVPSARNMQLFSAGSEAALEIIQHLAVILAICLIMKKVKAARALREKMLRKIGKTPDIREGVFPFSSIYKKNNPLQRSALFTAVIISAFLVLSRLVFDIFVGGLPVDAIDFLWIVLHYLGDILVGVLCYLLMLLILMKFDSHHQKLKSKYDEE